MRCLESNTRPSRKWMVSNGALVGQQRSKNYNHHNSQIDRLCSLVMIGSLWFDHSSGESRQLSDQSARNRGDQIRFHGKDSSSKDFDQWRTSLFLLSAEDHRMESLLRWWLCRPTDSGQMSISVIDERRSLESVFVRSLFLFVLERVRIKLLFTTVRFPRRCLSSLLVPRFERIVRAVRVTWTDHSHRNWRRWAIVELCHSRDVTLLPVCVDGHVVAKYWMSNVWHGPSVRGIRPETSIGPKRWRRRSEMSDWSLRRVLKSSSESKSPVETLCSDRRLLMNIYSSKVERWGGGGGGWNQYVWLRFLLCRVISASVVHFPFPFVANWHSAFPWWTLMNSLKIAETIILIFVWLLRVFSAFPFWHLEGAH